MHSFFSLFEHLKEDSYRTTEARRSGAWSQLTGGAHGIFIDSRAPLHLRIFEPARLKANTAVLAFSNAHPSTPFSRGLRMCAQSDLRGNQNRDARKTGCLSAVECMIGAGPDSIRIFKTLKFRFGRVIGSRMRAWSVILGLCKAPLSRWNLCQLFDAYDCEFDILNGTSRESLVI